MQVVTYFGKCNINPLFSASEDTPTSCIQKLFPSQKAFCFRSPLVDEEDGAIFTPGDLHPVFQNQLWSLKDYIFSKSPKSSLGNTFLTGKGEFRDCFIFSLADIFCKLGE